jgi:hypothetical protein
LIVNERATYCYNCDSPAEGNYCSKCGQRTNVHKVTFRETFQDFWDFIFSVNAPFFKTVKGLFINPGKVLREYLAGRRKSYYKPVAFFLVMTVVYLLIRSLIGYDPFGNTTLNVTDESQRQLLTKARNFMLLNIDKLLFVFVFTMGLFLKLFFFRKRSLAEFLAVSFYLIAVYTIFTILNMFFINYVDSQVQYLAMLIMMVYFCYALISFFQKRKLLVLLKAIVVYFVSFVSYGLLAFAISFLIIYLKQL